MEVKKRTDRNKRKETAVQAVLVGILLLYPLRHITWGLDLWDTGYNYANFQYMGTEHMDSMWLFSTYLANGVGHFLTKLPFADGLAGMNFYTGLFVSLLAIAGYFFCTKKLGMRPWTAFLGEWTAISLCWCPTALLYNYLTYVLLLICVFFLYAGLYEGKRQYLWAAGACLGSNVFVRFSNLPEAALIIGVWAYAAIEGMEYKKRRAAEKEKPAGEKLPEKREPCIPVRAAGYTLRCLGGYLGALAVFGGYLHIRYGIDAYLAGIQRLFGMTENAPDYKASAMLLKLFGTYVENLYWVVRIGVIAGAGLVLFTVINAVIRKAPFVKNRERAGRLLEAGNRLMAALLAAAMLVWLYYRDFCSLEFYSYGSILRPGVLFLMLTMLIACIRIFQKGCPKQEKLISGMILLVALLTSIGSNNGVYPSINNLFLAAPYTFWQSFLFFKRGKEALFPLKTLLAAFLAMFVFQTALFGACFSFAEATGVQDISAEAENNEVLKGVRMSEEKARWLTEISGYVSENHLEGSEVILYGNLPSLSYYLQMPSAFNPWSDLASYHLETMQEALTRTKEEIAAGGARPVIIVENWYAQYEQGGREALSALGAGEKQTEKITADKKWEALKAFKDALGYEKTFSNEKFTVWE